VYKENKATPPKWTNFGYRSFKVNLNYGQAADGRVETEPLPLLGPVNSEYDSRQFVVLDIKYTWR